MVADAAKKDKPEEKKGKNAKDEKKDEMVSNMFCNSSTSSRSLQSDEDKKLEEDLNMLVKRLGVSLFPFLNDSPSFRP